MGTTGSPWLRRAVLSVSALCGSSPRACNLVHKQVTCGQQQALASASLAVLLTPARLLSAHYSLRPTRTNLTHTHLIMLSHPPSSPTATACMYDTCKRPVSHFRLSCLACEHRYLYCYCSAAASIGVWPRALVCCVNSDVPISPSAVPRAAPTLPL